MSSSPALVRWDTATFGIPCYELRGPATTQLLSKLKKRGHYSIKVDPLSNKKALHHQGFYYCDTLIEPFCVKDSFIAHENPDIRFSKSHSFSELKNISVNTYHYGRFHRDFNVKRSEADQRYIRWLKELNSSGCVYSLFYKSKFSGYIACQGNKLVLHALSVKVRGRGLAKFFWTPVCRDIFSKGHREILSSISAANTAAVNLYSALGFKFRNPLDIYHKRTDS